MVAISAHDTIMGKFANFCKAIFYVHYNIFQPNFGILLLLKGSFEELVFFVWICLDKKLVYKRNCPLNFTHPSGSCNFDVFENLTRACFFPNCTKNHTIVYTKVGYILAEFAYTIYPSGLDRLIWQMFLLIVNEYYSNSILVMI